MAVHSTMVISPLCFCKLPLFLCARIWESWTRLAFYFTCSGPMRWRYRGGIGASNIQKINLYCIGMTADTRNHKDTMNCMFLSILASRVFSSLRCSLFCRMYLWWRTPRIAKIPIMSNAYRIDIWSANSEDNENPCIRKGEIATINKITKLRAKNVLS